jgi:hypothetical protein
VACVVANNTAIMVGTGMSLADLPERMATLGIIYKTVEAYLLIIVTSGKFDLWSTMGIFELNQACTRRKVGLHTFPAKTLPTQFTS